MHRNRGEKHRELGMSPQAPRDRAKKEKRNVLRPAPRCPWWPYVWSERMGIKVGADGRVPAGSQSVRLEVAPSTKVLFCYHPSGHYSVQAGAPDRNTKPVLLFTNRPT